MTLIFYLSRFVGLRIFVVCLCLLTLGIGVDLIKTAPELLEFGGASAVAKYAVFRVPAMLATTLPIATLIGGLIAMLSLSQNSELTIIRGAGISTHRLVLWLIPLAFVLGAVHYLSVDRGIAWSGKSLGATFGEIADIDVPKIGRVVAARDGDKVLYGKLGSLDGMELKPFTSFTLDQVGNVIQRTNAVSARYAEGIWTLDGVQRTRINTAEGQNEELPQLSLKLALTPQLVLDLASKAKAIDTRHALAVLGNEVIATRGTAFYEMQVNRSLVAWIIPFVMLLIGMLGSYKLPRSMAGLGAAAAGFALGICYVGVDGLFTSLGRLGVVSVEFASYTPSFSFALIALAALRRLEG